MAEGEASKDKSAISLTRIVGVSPSTIDSVEKVDKSHRLKFWMREVYVAVAFSFSTSKPSAPANVSEHMYRYPPWGVALNAREKLLA